MRKLMFAMLLTGCTFEAHCGAGQDTIKQNEAEASAADGLRKQGLTVNEVHCDTAGVPPEVGKTFVCNVTLDDQKTYGYRAKITARHDDRIDFDLDPVEPNTVNTRKLAPMLVDALGKELGVDVTVDCHDALRPLPDSRVLACDAVLGGYAHTIEAHVDDQMNVTDVTFGGQDVTKKVEAVFLKANPTATIDCGKDPVVTTEGLQCQVDGEHGPATITMHTAADGTISWTQR